VTGVAIATDPIKITGLAEFNRSLRQLDRNAPKALRLVGNEAAQSVVKDAQANAPKLSGALSASIKASSTRTSARVREGGAKVPYAGFIDYGGNVGRNGATQREFVKSGRILYPAFNRNRDAVAESLEEGLTKVIEDSGLAVD
jgi:phage gpG-like protein